MSSTNVSSTYCQLAQSLRLIWSWMQQELFIQCADNFHESFCNQSSLVKRKQANNIMNFSLVFKKKFSAYSNRIKRLLVSHWAPMRLIDFVKCMELKRSIVWLHKRPLSLWLCLNACVQICYCIFSTLCLLCYWVCFKIKICSS